MWAATPQSPARFCNADLRARSVPVKGHFDLRDPAAYLQPLQCLGLIAKELTEVAYGTKC